MVKFFSILKATALEILSEPLSLLVLLAALAMTVFAPAFHYHQFGEATRMARDAGFSALFTCGSVLAVFGTIRAFRREVESGTLEMALAHPVSRAGFFLAKTAGAAVAYLAFALIVFGTQLTIVLGAAIGGILASRSGDIASVFEPALAAGVAVMLVPLVLAAILNRFARFRFVLTCFGVAFVLALLFGGAALFLATDLLAPYPAAAVLIACPALVLLAASAAAFAFSARFFWRAPIHILMMSENAAMYTITAMITSVMYSLYAVRFVICRPAMSRIDMKQPVKMTAIGLFTASSATAMPLKPADGRDWYVVQKNSVLPAR